jgi:lysophospholipase L1-like esterase
LRILVAIFCSVIPVIILFACLEIAFRYTELRNAHELPRHGENGTYIPVKMNSYYRGTMAGIPVSTNRYGLRDEPDFNPEPPAGEFRIVSMGDSIAFGLGISSQNAYAKVLERKLNETGGGSQHYYVINASGPGISPSCYYMALKNEILNWHPATVLMEIELTNDVTDEALMRWEMDPQHPGYPMAVRGGRYVVSWDGMILSSYVRGPYFYEKTYTYIELSRRILNLLYQFSSPKPYPTSPGECYYTLQHEHYLLTPKRIEDGWARMFRALLLTNELLKQRNVPFLLMIMPSRFVYEPDSGAHQNSFAQRLVARAVDFARNNSIPYIDFTQCIAAQGGDKVFLDTVHQNEKANSAIGSVLYEHLAAITKP